MYFLNLYSDILAKGNNDIKIRDIHGTDNIINILIFKHGITDDTVRYIIYDSRFTHKVKYNNSIVLYWILQHSDVKDLKI